MTFSIRGSRTLLIGVAAALLLLLFGSLTMLRAHPEKDDIVAIVNGVSITKDEFYEALENVIIQDEPIGQAVLRMLISETLLSEADHGLEDEYINTLVEEELEMYRELYGEIFTNSLTQLGLTEDDLRNEIRLSIILDHLVTKDVHVTDDDIKAFYEEHKSSFYTPELYRPAHIIVETETEANDLFEQIAAGASFNELAEQHSLDQSNWGLVSQQDPLPPIIEDVLFTLEVGEVSHPLALEDSYLLLRLEEIVPAQQETLDEVWDEIADYLRYEQSLSVDDLLETLWNDAQIEVLWERYRSIAGAN